MREGELEVALAQYRKAAIEEVDAIIECAMANEFDSPFLIRKVAQRGALAQTKFEKLIRLIEARNQEVLSEPRDRRPGSRR